MMPWFLKYKPKRFTELEFTDDSNFQVLDWLKQNKNGGVLHISGSSGIGKTALVYLAAKVCKYNLIEYSDLTQDQLKQLNSRTINGTKCLILVDEADVPNIQYIPKFHGIPVVYVSINKYSDCIKITKPDSQTILKVIKRILKQEKKQLCDKIILHLCLMCNSDIRAVINTVQLLSCINEVKNFRFVERVTAHSLNYACRQVFSKRLRFNELESVYSEKLLEVCLNNVISKSKELNALRVFESISETANYPDSYRFIALENINKIRLDYEYLKENTIEVSKKQGHKEPIHFLNKYKRNLQNKRSVKHLQQIFIHYKIKNLSGIDKEILDYVEIKEIDEKIFKYKFNSGSSSAVRRDIKIDEIMNI